MNDKQNLKDFIANAKKQSNGEIATIQVFLTQQECKLLLTILNKKIKAYRYVIVKKFEKLPDKQLEYLKSSAKKLELMIEKIKSSAGYYNF